MTLIDELAQLRALAKETEQFIKLNSYVNKYPASVEIAKTTLAATNKRIARIKELLNK